MALTDTLRIETVSADKRTSRRRCPSCPRFSSRTATCTAAPPSRCWKRWQASAPSRTRISTRSVPSASTCRFAIVKAARRHAARRGRPRPRGGVGAHGAVKQYWNVAAYDDAGRRGVGRRDHDEDRIARPPRPEGAGADVLERIDSFRRVCGQRDDDDRAARFVGSRAMEPPCASHDVLREREPQPAAGPSRASGPCRRDRTARIRARGLRGLCRSPCRPPRRRTVSVPMRACARLSRRRARCT